MKVFNVRDLKHNPSEAMRAAKKEVVVVLNRDSPEVVMLNANDPELERLGARVALALALYRDNAVTLAKAARIANMPLVDFMKHASAHGIPVIKGDAESLQEELRNFAEWKKRASSRTRGR
jgi:predicted HTH domain antitoxin